MTDNYIQQVGGAHYEYGERLNQHWDLMSRWGIEYLPATATKYVLRWDRKGTPLLDLEKSRSYVQKQLTIGHCVRFIPYIVMQHWFVDNMLRAMIQREAEKRLLFELIHVDGTIAALEAAAEALTRMIGNVDQTPTP